LNIANLNLAWNRLIWQEIVDLKPGSVGFKPGFTTFVSLARLRLIDFYVAAQKP